MKDDTSRVLILSDLSFYILFFNADSGLIYADRAIDLAEKTNFVRGKVRALAAKASLLETKGDLPAALQLSFAALELAEQQKLLLETSMCLTVTANIFYDLNDYTRAIGFYRRALPINEVVKNQIGARSWKYQTDVNLGTAFMLNNQNDSSFAYLSKAYKETFKDDVWHPVFSMFFGALEFRMGHRETGINYLIESLQLFKDDTPYSLSDVCRMLSRCYSDMNMPDSAIHFAEKGLAAAQSIGYKTTILETSRLLSELYEPKDLKTALYYRKIYDTTNNILYGTNKVRDLQKTLLNEQDRQRKIEAENVAYQNRVKQYGLLGGLFIILLVAFILYRNNLQRKKSNVILSHQKEQLELTLKELKSTQSQLIQSEKMASLGELTAGIAHEIQNPLNFVNNFSEVNGELVDELKAQLATGNLQLATEIADDLKDNESKILYHGKRADAIVKGMLQHSRTSAGQKEPTDINALADEYLCLSYHGMRARDKDFNAEIKTSFDTTIGKINIVPQDIGRVLLNLYNNAFYATADKLKGQSSQLAAQASPLEATSSPYVPTVTVITKKYDAKISISVKDNGPGIPQNIVDKIFQPFFTTKPTGDGTGLGLSLSYDIIKAHGGEIKVETLSAAAAAQAGKEGEGTEFIIQLPLLSGS
ncbi:MAG TPA: ATP-binding protein [Parafilimonas sp.]|nr:ATP-binding protein [Parafilimonas sp.]